MKPVSPPRQCSSLALWCCLSLALAGAGCGLTKPSGASFASVTIHDRSPEEITRATTQVFVAEGYRGGGAGSSQMVFEKEGTRGDNIAYQGVVGSHYGAETAVRVRAEIVDLGSGKYRLQCQAYMVRDPGQGIFEEEQRLVNARSRPYQSLLNQVAKQLK